MVIYKKEVITLTRSSPMSIHERYWIYSAEEENLRKKIHGPNASFGTVIVNGIPKRYTSIVTDPKNSKTDAIVVAKGNISKVKFTSPGKV